MTYPHRFFMGMPSNFSLPPKPEEDIQENRDNYPSFAPASKLLKKSHSLKKG